MIKLVLSVVLLAGGGLSYSGFHGTAGSIGSPQAVIDPNFNSRVASPANVSRHPRVLFDEAHNNADTSGGRYKPFADLITSDGYKITPNTGPFTKSGLQPYEVLVIVNPTGPEAERERSAFTEEECKAVLEWTREGGSLLLIIDHLPFSAASAGLSKSLGVEFTRGWVIDKKVHNPESDDETELLFARDTGLLGDHAITQGRNASEKINRIISFAGTSLKGPAGSVAFLKLADSALDVLPPDTKPAPGEQEADYKTVSASGRAQAIAFQVGKGRVVVMGEAAMLTAQVARRGFVFGMNVAGIDNRQLALNIMHWLSGLLK